jgi:predicted ATPase with chaperone activity
MDTRLAGLLDRINTLATGNGEPVEPDEASGPAAAADSSARGRGAAERHHQVGEGPESAGRNEFRPPAPTSLREAQLTETEVESLILKYLLVRGEAVGRVVADQIRLPFGLVEPLLRTLKSEQVVVYKDTTEFNDYLYTLTDLGRERARRFMRDCSYYGSAPVSLEHYVASVAAQSLQHQSPKEAELREAFSDLLINPQMFNRLGPAINSSRGLFLYGYPGNGKTSIAERITLCFGQQIWIPRALGIAGEIIRFFDPNHHQEVPAEEHGGYLQDSRCDARWVKIRRPTIIVGGELTMEMLELQLNPNNGTIEAPFQLKSNCGTLVIDDFGRQRMSTDELLNRWIVPLGRLRKS